MIRLRNKSPKVMEFTKFEKAENVTDEDLITSLMTFEKEYLSKQEGIIFHCLVRNLKGEYANLLFADTMNSLKNIEEGFMENDASKNFMGNINPQTVKIHYHEILKENFQVPENFACFEHGTFVIKKDIDFTEKNMLSISNKIETEYLNTFDNSLGHFMGKINKETYSELAFGKTLGKTREICYGYFGIDAGMELLNLYVPEKVDLDFWYLIA